MTATLQTVAKPTEQELVMTRVFDAPRVLVWKAWTEREHLLRWSCPKDFTMLFSEGDLNVDGAWRAGMRSPEGREYVMGGQYREITPPERLVFTHGWEKDELHDDHETLVTVRLEENNGCTLMTFTQSNLATASSRDGHAEGWTGAFDNLSNLLQQLQYAPEEL
jgi:uncharacterized protein YndB with AHSA1/START domain